MTTSTEASRHSLNPFAMLVAPEQVILRMERSDELGRLKRRLQQPLEKRWIDHRLAQIYAATREIDAEIDAEMDEQLPEEGALPPDATRT